MGIYDRDYYHWLNPFAPGRRPAYGAVTARPSGRRRRVRALQKDWSKDFNR